MVKTGPGIILECASSHHMLSIVTVQIHIKRGTKILSDFYAGFERIKIGESQLNIETFDKGILNEQIVKK